MAGTCCGGAAGAKSAAGASCCGGSTAERAGSDETRAPIKVQRWMTGAVETAAGAVPRVATKLTFADRLGSWRCRWDIGRMDYTVEPGLYCVGSPGAESPVLVTANYKMTFDRLRMELGGLDAWILVLDTKGVNVWCAAGEGTFGTEELLHRLSAVRLQEVVSHRALILPQLGATGVSAHEVAKRSKFHVVYGPVRAEDIKAFLSAGMHADEAMRTVRFTLWDRLVLTPVEIVNALKPSMILFGILFILNAVGLGHYGLYDMLAWVGAILAGGFLTPVLLPWIPGRAFAFKGLLLGLAWAAGAFFLFFTLPMAAADWLKAAAYLLILPSFSSFAAMNFTGASTYTSLSGVDREMKFALLPMIIATALGIVALLTGDFIRVFS